jgi:hypothetical protein
VNLGLIVLTALTLACKKDKFEESNGIYLKVIASNSLNSALGLRYLTS